MRFSIAGPITITILLIAVGCATPGLPRGARMVGGGTKIEYFPKDEGTAILVENNSKKIISTMFVNQSIAFKFDACSPEGADVVNAALGTSHTNVQFVLYFVPQ